MQSHNAQGHYYALLRMHIIAQQRACTILRNNAQVQKGLPPPSPLLPALVCTIYSTQYIVQFTARSKLYNMLLAVACTLNARSRLR